MSSTEPTRQLHRSAAARALARWTRPGAETADGDPATGTVVPTPAPGDSRRACTDAQLVALIRERDPDAFELVHDRHAASAFGLARRMVGDHALAEDVTQEAFISMWRSCHLYRPERGSVRTWVLGITHHRAIDALRRRSVQARLKATQEQSADRLDVRESTDGEALRNEEASALRKAIETLPTTQRRAIELAYFTGLTHTEIAAELDLPLGTVKGRMRLALEKLRATVNPDDVVA